MGPGATALTVMPASPHSSAIVRVMLSMAAFAALACTCRDNGIALDATLML